MPKVRVEVRENIIDEVTKNERIRRNLEAHVLLAEHGYAWRDSFWMANDGELYTTSEGTVVFVDFDPCSKVFKVIESIGRRG